MRTLAELLRDVDARGITLVADGETLRVRAAGEVPAALRAELAERKRELLRHLALRDAPIVAAERGTPAPLSLYQRRLWLTETLNGPSAAFNMQVGWSIDGPLDVSALEFAVSEVLARHDVLRSTIEGEPPMMVVGERSSLAIGMTDVERPFDLRIEPPVRASLIRIDDTHHLFHFTLHHIAADPQSIGILARELSHFYASRTPLPLPPIQYGDFARWQREMFDPSERIAYWRKQLDGARSDLDLPIDYRRTLSAERRGGALPFTIDGTLANALRALGQRHGATPFMTLLAAYAVLLARVSRQDELTIGCPYGNREREEVRDVVGFFVSTLVLRMRLGGNPTFAELLQRVRATCLGAFANDVPFDTLVEALQPVRTPGLAPFFQAMFVLQTADVSPLRLGEAHVTPLPTRAQSVEHDLNLTLRADGEALHGLIEYDAALFEVATIEQMARSFVTLLEHAVEDPSCTVARLRLLAEPEVALGERVEGTTDVPVHELVRASDAIAIESDGRTLTYRELDDAANEFAASLEKRSVVGITMARSPELIVAMLGVLRAGAAYVVIDPQQPVARREAIARASGMDIAPAAPPLGLAYLCFTSGSTGTPKGVMVEHAGLANLALSSMRAYELTARDRVLQFAAPDFDVINDEVWPTLIAGATLVLAPPQLTDSLEAFQRFVEEQRLTVLNLPAAMWHAWVWWLVEHDRRPPASLRLLVTGSDRVSPERLAQWRRIAPDVAWINAYGPTEATVETTLDRGTPNAISDAVPIGKPIANTSIVIVDELLQSVPRGVTGEICIGGAGVARGYIGEPARTAETFVADPFSRTPGARMVRTGDLGRLLADGTIEILGRRDEQLKVRGFRIEPGEIAAVLDRCPGVVESAVVAIDTRIVAFVSTKLDAATLRAWAHEHLPSWMVPSAFVPLDKLPLSSSGKVDRRALAAMSIPASADELTLPRTRVEEVLARVWSDVLGKRVGVFDNFFELGGDSILALQAVARARQQGLAITARAIFEGQNVARVAAQASVATEDRAPVIGDVPLAPIQRWFFEHVTDDAHHYNQAVMLAVPRDVDVDALRRALDALLVQHDMLRCRFVDGRATIGPPNERVPFDEGPAALQRAHESLDLANGPLFRAVLINRERLFLVAHHLVVDAVSWGILRDDLAAAYAGLPLPGKTASYREWASRANEPTELTHAGAEEQILIALATAAGSPLRVDLERHGRDGELDVSRTVGWFTDVVPLRIELDASRRLRSTRDANGTATFLVNYLGKLPTDDRPFAFLDEDCGIAQSPRIAPSHAVEINAMTVKGELRIDWKGGGPEREFRDALARLDETLPLTPMQEGILFHSLAGHDPSVYFDQLTLTLAGPLDTLALRDAWQRVVARHAALRTSFEWQSDVPLQRISRNVALPWREEDWRDLDASAQESRMCERLRDDRARGFALHEAPLMRVLLVRTGDARYELLWSAHHLVLDGWSTSILLREVHALYAGATLAEPPSFASYLRWLRAQDRDAAQTFWRKELAAFTEPTGIESVSESAIGGGHRDVVLTLDDTAALQRFARAQRVTINTMVQGAWAILLRRHARTRDVLFGVTVSGRPAELDGAQELVGVLINSIPARVDVDDDAIVGPWLRALRDRQLDWNQYAYASLVDVQKASGVRGGQALFETLILFQNYPLPATLNIEHIRIDERTNYPVTLVGIPGDTLGLQIHFDREHLDDDAADRLLGELQTLLREMASDAERTLGSLESLSRDHREQLLAWGTGAATALECALLTERMRAHDRDAIAIVSGATSMTYGELDAASNRIAHWLRANGVERETPVGVCLPRGIDMIVAILGIWKAGGTYVPLDAALPEERLAYMLSDCGATLVVTDSERVAVLPMYGVLPLCLDLDADVVAAQSNENAFDALQPDAVAYIIYTSGSTGRPKGVSSTHRGLASLAQNQARAFGLGAKDRVLQFASPSFDASLWEVAMAFGCGAALCVAPIEQMRAGEPLMRLLREQHISAVTLPPTALAASNVEPLPELRVLVVAGEASTPELAEQWRVGLRFFNAYGPTEASVCATMQEIGKLRATLPIGVPLDRVQTFVLDERLRPVPIGVTGELYIGGTGLARGYTRQPALTATRFIANPFADGERLYRSGDLARVLPDGAIEFRGRVDHQVKVRGYRVELGEIETQLAQHPRIRECAVLHVEQHLEAWIAADDPPSLEELRAFLAQRLPDYMVPARFTMLPLLPLTNSGKIDRKKLLSMDSAPAQPSLARIAPRDDAERALARVWRDVLRLPNVGIHDNFFDLGGDSILAIHVVTRAAQAGVPITLQQIMDAPTQTIATLCEAVRNLPVAIVIEEEEDESGEVPLTPIQQWFFELDSPEPHHYHQTMLLRVEREIDDAWLAAAQRKLERHDALRQAFGIPLYRLVHDRANKTLRIVIHHLAVDAVSWRVILEELFGEIAPTRTSSFRKWARRLAIYADSDDARHELPYWLADERMSVAAIFDIEPGTYGETMTVEAMLTASQTARALRGGKIEELALTALALSIREVLQSSTTFVDLEWHGRDTRFADVDVSNTVGWFTVLAPLLLTLPADADRENALAAVRQQLRAMPHHGLGFGALRYLASDPVTRELLASMPRPQIAFNYLGQVDAVFPPGVRPLPDDEPSFSPLTPRAHVLEVSAIVTDGRLHVDFRVPPQLADVARRLSETFVRALAALLPKEHDPLEGLDTFIAREMRTWGIPAFAVGVIRDGRIIHRKGYGGATPRTLFGLGSITKLFNATWLAVLQKRGVLSWDEPICRYVPDIAFHDPEVTRAVTLRDLISNRSGLPSADFLLRFSGFSRREMVESLPHLALRPFRAFHYSNFGAVVAAHVAERVSGSSWEEGLRRDVLEPLGMNATPTRASAHGREVARPHHGGFGRLAEEMTVEQPDAAAPAHGVHADLDAALTLLALHMNLGSREEEQFFAREDAQSMQWPHVQVFEPVVSPGPEYDPDLFGALHFGPGLMLTTYRGHRLVFHTGHGDGFSAQIAWLPDRGIGAVVLANLDDSLVPTWMAYHLFDRLLGLEPVAWSERMAHRVSSATTIDAREPALRGDR